MGGVTVRPGALTWTLAASLCGNRPRSIDRSRSGFVWPPVAVPVRGLRRSSPLVRSLGARATTRRRARAHACRSQLGPLTTLTGRALSVLGFSVFLFAVPHWPLSFHSHHVHDSALYTLERALMSDVSKKRRRRLVCTPPRRFSWASVKSSSFVSCDPFRTAATVCFVATTASREDKPHRTRLCNAVSSLLCFWVSK